jgi:3-methyl-2-oxobutanoate hydroxymethyltransferase
MKHSDLNLFKERGEKITCLTAYDSSIAKLIDDCGVDVVLIGDSLGMVIQGHKNTRSVTMQDMLYHTEIVANSCQQALVIADMPFQSYDSGELALINAQNLVNVGADMVKIEGGQEHEEVFRVLSSSNINICGHLGLQPQMVADSSEYKIQGKDENSAELILSDALLLESLGISSLVLECIPSALAKEVSSKLNIPTIGIGAGKDCDGQVLVCYDMLGITQGKLPRFVRNFVSTEGTIPLAISAFVKEVKAGTFPSTSESY